MLRTLIWKDVLANRFSLLLAAILLVAAYGLAAIMGLLDPMMTAQPSWGRRLAEILFFGSLMSYAMAHLSLAVLSGNLIAGERVRRSAEFLAYLPPSRWMVLRAKATVLGAVSLLLLFIPLAMTGLGAFFDKASLVDIYRKTASGCVVIWAMGFCASGIGWLASCCLQSNAVAILFALLSPYILMILITLMIQSAEPTAILVAANLSIGLAGFLFGTMHYLNRVEP